MNKTIMFLGMLVVGFANAQQTNNYDGKVGINTEEPKATLDIVANKTDGSQKEGLLIPRLGKTAISKIAQPEVSTLVYVNDVAYTTGEVASDKRVELVNTVGFYHYNGAQWVKHLDTDTNSELWAQRETKGITETYLKPATASGDEYMYSPKRSYINLGNAQEIVGASGFKYLNAKKDVPNLLMINATALPTGDTALGQYGKRYIPFSREVYTIDENYRPEAGEIMKYFGRELTLQGKNLNTDIGYLIGHNIGVDFQSSSKTVQLVGGRFGASAGDKDAITTPVVKRIIGVHSNPTIYSGTGTDLVGTFNDITPIGGSIDNLIGTENKVYTDKNINNGFKDVLGTRSNVLLNTSTSANRLYGHLSYTNFNATSTIKSEAAGIATSAYIKAGSTIKTFMGVRSYINAEAGANVTDMYGFRFQEDLKEGFAPENLYGLYIGAVKRGTQNNFSIYTNEGKIRFGDLASTSATDDRPVYVDANGVLKIGTAPASTAPAETIIASNGLTKTGSEVKLGGALSEATTITQGDKSLTISNTGTGRFIVDGNKQDNKAVYVKVSDPIGGTNGNLREHSAETSPVYTADDYMIILTNENLDGKLQLPDATQNKGRIIYLINGTTSGIGFIDNAVTTTPFNVSILSVGTGVGYVSNGKTWYPLAR